MFILEHECYKLTQYDDHYGDVHCFYISSLEEAIKWKVLQPGRSYKKTVIRKRIFDSLSEIKEYEDKIVKKYQNLERSL